MKRKGTISASTLEDPDGKLIWASGCSKRSPCDGVRLLYLPLQSMCANVGHPR